MHRLLGKVLRPLWRMTRGLTLGAQGLVLDEQNRVLLVRHGYHPGWHFPGGGVERGESLLDALSRELREEVGIELVARPELHGVFTNFKIFPGDHVAVFVVRHWRQTGIPRPNLEIREQKFVPLDQLPADLAKGPRARISEVFEGVEVAVSWVGEPPENKERVL